MVDSKQKCPYLGLSTIQVWVGPSMCPLYKANNEDVDHLFVICSYMVHGSYHASHLQGQHFIWHGIDFNETMKNWIQNLAYKSFLSLPMILIWGIWLARNQVIFEDVQIPPLCYVSKEVVISIISHKWMMVYNLGRFKLRLFTSFSWDYWQD